MNVADLSARVRSILAGDLTDADEVRTAAQQWADLLTETLRRLEQASEWARRGLRTEALALAAASPSIYEVALAAQDPSLAPWRDHCARHRLPRAPALPVERLDLLTECHLQVEPLKEALARWRKLNIGRAAATERLDQMRALRRLDPGNPVWTSDSPALERAALAEAIEACERQLALWELDHVRNVVRWIEQGEWLDAPARAASESMRRRITELSGRSALERARIVVERLHQEYMAESVDAAEAQLREWDALRAFLADSGVQLPAELEASVQPVVEWILERHEASQRVVDHRTTIAELAASVEAPDATLPALALLLARAQSGPEQPPAALVASARRRLAALRRARAVRRGVAVTVAIAVVIALGIAAKAMLDRHAHRVAGERLVLTIRGLLDQDDLEAARHMFADQRVSDPLLKEHPALQTATELIAEATAAQVRRDTEFAAKLIEAGDPADPGADPALVEALAPLARTTTHREQVELWKSAYARAESARQERIDLAFAQSLSELERELDAVSTLDTAETTTRLSRARTRLDELEDDEQVSTAARLRARPLRVRLESLVRAADDARQRAVTQAAEAASLARLPALLGDPDALASSLLSFADEFPDSVHGEPFRTAAIDLASWRAAIAWPAAATPAVGRLDTASDGERAELRRQLVAYLSAHPTSAHATGGRRALEHLESQNEWRRWLSNVIDGSPIFALQAVTLRNGDRYYYEASSAPQPTSDGQRVYRIVRRLNDPARGVFDGEYVRIDPRQIVSDEESPQRKLAQALRAALRGAGYEGVKGGLEVVKQLRDATNVDPVLRADLMLGLLQQLQRAAPPLAPAMAEAERRLADLEPESLVWLDPRSADARERGREMEAALSRVVEVDRWRDEWRKSVAEAEKLLSERLEPAGLLLRDSDRAEIVSPKPLDPGPLVAIVVSGTTTRAVTIGSVDAARRASLDPAASTIPSGTPVFRPTGTTH